MTAREEAGRGQLVSSKGGLKEGETEGKRETNSSRSLGLIVKSKSLNESHVDSLDMQHSKLVEFCTTRTKGFWTWS